MELKKYFSIYGFLLACLFFTVSFTIFEYDSMQFKPFLTRGLFVFIYALIFLLPILVLLSYAKNEIKITLIVSGVILAILPDLFSILIDGTNQTLSYSIFDNVQIIKDGEYTPIGLRLKVAEMWKLGVLGGLSGFIYYQLLLIKFRKCHE